VKWTHGRDLSLNGLRPGLEVLKTAVERAVESNKAELDRLRQKMGPFTR
jgi:hypothetical protein